MAKLKNSAVAPDDDWQARSDVQTLMEAHKIKADKKRHAAAKRHARQQLKAMQGVAQGDENGQATD